VTKRQIKTRFGTFVSGWDANDVWQTRCAGMATRDATPDEAEAWRQETRLTDEGIAAAKAYGFNEFEIATLQDFVLIRERDGYHEKIYFECGVFKVERYRTFREASS
jgi:hypothetical protein